MMNLTKSLALICFIAGSITLLFFLSKAGIDGYSVLTWTTTDYEVTGQFGDFVGGIVGTFFALTGTLLIYLTFQEQTKENKRSAFESSFFEMIKLHRENVTELQYRKHKNGQEALYENRMVFRIIFQEFIECYREVKKYSNSKDVNDYVTTKYQERLQELIDNINPNISLIEMARIDIAYSILFYGLGDDGESVIRKNFKGKYNPEYYFKLLYFIKLKPKKSNQTRFGFWEKVRALDLKELHSLIGELYQFRTHPDKIKNPSALASELKMHLPYEKYYGGHQFRLGHYFRHLYQSYKYLHHHKDVKDNDRYSYGKLFRAQLSTYEQALLFINSISSLGMNWEYTPEKAESIRPTGMITEYNLIKNLPGDHSSGIRYKSYYGNVVYESDEQTFSSTP
ncbi:MAG: putative phage abortive infection protein [Pseudoalteromonas distincta]